MFIKQAELFWNLSHEFVKKVMNHRGRVLKLAYSAEFCQQADKGKGRK